MAGRPGKYKTHIEPFLSEISTMALTYTEQEIAHKLGVNYTTFREYKRQYPTLRRALSQRKITAKNDRDEELKTICNECIDSLIKCARGYDYTEKKVIREGGKVKREEITTKHAKPDAEAIKLLLSNFSKEWSNDRERNEIRKEELALKKKIAERDDWSNVVDVSSQEDER